MDIFSSLFIGDNFLQDFLDLTLMHINLRMALSIKEPSTSGESNEKENVDLTVATDIDSFNYDEPEKFEEMNVFAAEDNLSSRLTARHVSMISLVMVFGTGIFLLSGGSLAEAGPVCIFLA